MSNDNDYEIIPSKINPKFGIVVSTQEEKKEFVPFGEQSNKTGLQEWNNREGYKSVIIPVSDNKYHLTATHKFHFLHHEMGLEISPHGDEPGKSLLCSFVPFDVEQLIYIVSDDDFLLGAIIYQFQMNLMHHLLRFCHDQKLQNIIIYVDTDRLQLLDIYEEIITRKLKIGGLSGTKTKIIIKANAKTLRQWEDVVKTMRHEFIQSLWREQKTNVIAREYLKLNPCHELFC